MNNGVTIEEVRSVRCPFCGAGEGAPCIRWGMGDEKIELKAVHHANRFRQLERKQAAEATAKEKTK